MAPADDRRDIESIRAYVEGRLAPAERAELDARAARDPDLAALLSAYGEIHAVTADEPPALSLAFDDLRLDDAPPAPVLWMPRVAIAAAAVLALGLGVYLSTRGTERTIREVDRPPSVALAAIPLDPPVLVETPEVPASLADYGPVGEKGLRFLTDLDDARALSKFTGRPLVVFVYHPTCPYCIQYAKGQFLSPTLHAVAGGVVLAKLDVTKMEDHPDVSIEGLDWPPFLVFDPAGTRKAAFGGYLKDSKEMATALSKALATAGWGSAPAYDWSKARAWARALLDAEAESATLATRYETCARVAREDPTGALGAVAKARLTGLASGAHWALTSAQIAMQNEGAQEALSRLDASAKRYAGTPYAPDFDAVRACIARGEPFPHLEARR